MDELQNTESQISEVDQEFLGDLTKNITGQKVQDFFLDELDGSVNLLLENGIILKFPLKDLWIAIPTPNQVLL